MESLSEAAEAAKERRRKRELGATCRPQWEHRAMCKALSQGWSAIFLASKRSKPKKPERQAIEILSFYGVRAKKGEQRIRLAYLHLVSRRIVPDIGPPPRGLPQDAVRRKSGGKYRSTTWFQSGPGADLHGAKKKKHRFYAQVRGNPLLGSGYVLEAGTFGPAGPCRRIDPETGEYLD